MPDSLDLYDLFLLHLLFNRLECLLCLHLILTSLDFFNLQLNLPLSELLSPLDLDLITLHLVIDDSSLNLLKFGNPRYRLRFLPVQRVDSTLKKLDLFDQCYWLLSNCLLSPAALLSTRLSYSSLDSLGHLAALEVKTQY